MKTKIVETTVNMCHIHGIKAIKMSDIAVQMGISKRTLYQHFQSKDELLKECIKYRMTEEGIHNQLQNGLLDQLINFSQVYQSLCHTVNRRSCIELRELHQSTYLFLIQYLSEYASSCENKVYDGICNGFIRRDVASNLVYTFLSEQFAPFFSEHPYYGEKINNDLAGDIILTFARGIATIKGRWYLNKELKERYAS